MSTNENQENRPISDLLKYSGAYGEMSSSERFDDVLTPQDAKVHPILKEYEIDEFYLRRLKYLPEIPNIDFYNSGMTSVRKVPKRSIVGTNHSAYAGRTWLTDLTVLQRGYCKTEEDVLCLSPAEGARFGGLVSLSLYGDEYYIIDGDDYVTQTQFAPSVTKVPSLVTEYTFDKRRYGLAYRIQKTGAVLECPGAYKIGNKIMVQYGSLTLHIRFDEAGLACLESTIQQSIQLSGRKLWLFFLSRCYKDILGRKLWYNLCEPDGMKQAVIKMASMRRNGDLLDSRPHEK